MHQAAAELGITASTLFRWLNDGFVPGEQITPGAPWRIRLTESIRISSPTTPPPAGFPSRSPPRPSASPGRQCCSVSSAANSAPSNPRRTQERPAYRTTRPPRRAVLAIPGSEGAV